jgi:hypothetical protein
MMQINDWFPNTSAFPPGLSFLPLFVGEPVDTQHESISGLYNVFFGVVIEYPTKRLEICRSSNALH